MDKGARAAVAIDIAKVFHGRLLMDILPRTADPIERNELLAAVLGVVLRRVISDIPSPLDRNRWLEEIVRVAAV